MDLNLCKLCPINDAKNNNESYQLDLEIINKMKQGSSTTFAILAALICAFAITAIQGAEGKFGCY